MSADDFGFYDEWRSSRGDSCLLHDEACAPPERLLQRVWLHQRLLRDRLVLADGRPVRVLHPGFWNREAGPDFREAVVQFGSEPPRNGDVEIDPQPDGWRAHGHERNPAYGGVVLHVVWERPGAPGMPTLALKPFLDAPLAELARWLDNEGAGAVDGEWAGLCAAPLRDWAPGSLEELLEQAALARMQRKGSDFLARARQAGWEQALWEGLFRALGYKQNVWPMQRLGELRPRFGSVRAEDPAALAWQARLLGVSGLLPPELSRRERQADAYLRQVWDCWWRERDQFEDCLLPGALWRLSGLRPANRPERRLALAAHWWAAGDLPARLEAWFATPGPAAEIRRGLLKVFEAGEDPFWSRHWTLRSPAMEEPRPLLGEARVTDLAVNVVLPWFWARGRQSSQPAVIDEARRRYLAWGPGEDNAVLKRARGRLLAGRGAPPLRTAARQQGLLQIVGDFCERSDALCAGCPLPRLARLGPPSLPAQTARPAPSPDAIPLANSPQTV